MNKQDQREADKQTESLSDLPVAEEQAEGATGGGAPVGRLYLGTDRGVF